MFKATGAIVLTLLQCLLLFAAPVSACCREGADMSAHAAAADRQNDQDCCPPGSHPPGQCPLHKGKPSTTSRAADCRMRCDAAHAPDFVLGTIGVLAPSPLNAICAPPAAAIALGDDLVGVVRPARPDAPPPKSL